MVPQGARPAHLWPESEERTRAAVDKAYADRPEEGDAEARAAA